MVQALLNSININETAQGKHYSMSNNKVTTDFQALFKKQSNISRPENAKSTKEINRSTDKNNLTNNSEIQSKSNPKTKTNTTKQNNENNTTETSSDSYNSVKQEIIEENEDKKNIEDSTTENILTEVTNETTNNETTSEEDLEEDVVEEENKMSEENSNILPTENNIPILLNEFCPQLDTKQESLETSSKAFFEIENSNQTLNNTLQQTITELKVSKNINLDTTDATKLAENLTTKLEITETDLEETTEDDFVEEEMLKDLNIESIEVDNENTNFNGESDTSNFQNQSPLEHAIKATISSDIDFGDIKNEIKASSIQQSNINKTSTNNTPNPARILEQISKQMEGLQNNSKVNIVLNPESLGKVSIQLINTKEGLSAQFTVTTQEARNVIMKGIDGLKDSLMLHGINVDNVTVKSNSATESEFNENWTEQEGSRGGNKEQNQNQNGNQDKEKFEKMMAFIEKENGKV